MDLGTVSLTLVLLVLLALAFDFMNGFHDAANSIATVVSTGVLKPWQAVIWAAFFNVLAWACLPPDGGRHRRQGHHRSRVRRQPLDLRRADRRDQLEPHHLVLRHPVELLARAHRRHDRRRARQGRHRAAARGPASSRPRLHHRLAAARHAARLAADARRVVALLPPDAAARGQVVPAAAAGVVRRLLARATAATTRRRPWASSGCC